MILVNLMSDMGSLHVGNVDIRFMYVDVNINNGNLVMLGGNSSLPISCNTSGDVSTPELGDFTMFVKVTKHRVIN